MLGVGVSLPVLSPSTVLRTLIWVVTAPSNWSLGGLRAGEVGSYCWG